MTGVVAWLPPVWWLVVRGLGCCAELQCGRRREEEEAGPRSVPVDMLSLFTGYSSAHHHHHHSALHSSLSEIILDYSRYSNIPAITIWIWGNILSPIKQYDKFFLHYIYLTACPVLFNLLARFFLKDIFMKNREREFGVRISYFWHHLTLKYTQDREGEETHCFVIKRRKDENNELGVSQHCISSCLIVVANFLLYLIKIFKREKLFYL